MIALSCCNRGGFKGGHRGPRPPVLPLPTAPSKVNDAGIVLNYVVIASNCTCKRCIMSSGCNFTRVLLMSL